MLLTNTSLEREFKAIQKFSTWGIEVKLLSPSNIFEWIAKIKGLPATMWSGGVFSLFIKFSPFVTTKDPNIKFCTIPFHPNIDPTNGNVQLDFSSIPRRGAYILNILLHIQNLLSYPILENAINTSAKNILVNLPHVYKRIVSECVLNSRKLEDAHDLTSEESPSKTENSLHKLKQNLNNKPDSTSAKISFEKYHLDWLHIATSKVKHKK